MGMQNEERREAGREGDWGKEAWDREGKEQYRRMYFGQEGEKQERMGAHLSCH